MALWGNKDLVYGDGTVAVNFGTKKVTGTATTFTTAGITTGNVITVGTGATFGYAVVAAVDSDTVLSIYDTDNFVSGISTVAAGAGYFISEEPISFLGDSKYDAPETKTTGFSTNPVFTAVLGVDEIETGIAATTAYAVAHQGWVGVTTYTDCHGVSRVKSETLVAIGILTTSDASDDSLYPDS